MKIRTAMKGVLTAVLPEQAMEEVRKVHYRRKLRAATAHDEPDLAIAHLLVHEGDTAVDAGANFGLYTRFLSEAAGASGRVYSIEPVPPTFGVLSGNVAALHLANVVPVNCALSDRPGVVRMSVPHINGDENFYQAHISNNGEPAADRSFEVEARRLDDVVQAPAHLAFMKIDVESHELPVVIGAEGLIRRYAPALLIEISGNPDGEGPARDLIALLEVYGYKVFAADGLALHRRARGKRSVNYFFLRASHVERLRNSGIPFHDV